MHALRFLLTAPLLASLVLTAPAASAQTKHHKTTSTTTKTTTATKKTPPATPQPVMAESLSGLDLKADRNGIFAVRIAHRLTQNATLKLTDNLTKQVLRTELLEPNAFAVRAVEVGKLPNGEYKMEVILPDTIYWKSVKITHTRTRR